MRCEITKENIIIYGAHLVARECYRELCFLGYKDRVLGFAVTDMKDNPQAAEGLSVRVIDEYVQYADSRLVIIAVPAKYHKEIVRVLEHHGFHNYETVSLEEMSEKKADRLIAEAGKSLSYKLEISDNDPTWLDVFGSAGEKLIHCKYPTLFYLDDKEMLSRSKSLFDEYKERLSGISNLHPASATGTASDDDQLRIYMAYDKSVSDIVEDAEFDRYIYPLRVGADVEWPEQDGMFCDKWDGGLADKNRWLAEMTGAYWVWKKAPYSVYKGLCHYRRHFVINDKDVAALMENDADVLLTTPRYVPGGIYCMFTAETPVKDTVMQNIFSVMIECRKEDVQPFKEYLNTDFYFPNNMVIAKSEVYDAYCEWIFPILLGMLENDKQNAYGHETDRHIAYSAELLTSYYFIKRKDELKTLYTDYRFIDYDK